MKASMADTLFGASVTRSSSCSANSIFIEPCTRAVEFSLRHHLHDQAIFFAERLVAEAPTDPMLCLLCETYLRSGDAGRAHALLQERTEGPGNCEPRVRYLLALCCLQLGRLQEVEGALLGPGSRNLADAACGGPGLFVLGQAKEQLHEREYAIECYMKCLELCPFMWSAFERLSWLSPSTQSSARSFACTYFGDDRLKSDPVLRQGAPEPSSEIAEVGNAECIVPATLRKRRRHDQSTPPKLRQSATEGNAPQWQPPARSPLAERVFGSTPLVAPLPTPTPEAQPAVPGPSLVHTPVNLLSRLLSPRRLSVSLASPFGQPRARSPLGMRGSPPRTPSNSNAGFVWPQALLAGSSLTASSTAAPCLNSGDLTLGAVLRVLGEGLHSLHRFTCSHALGTLRSLPLRHIETGFVQDLMARCHFEMAEYREAASVFARCSSSHKLYRASGLEYYSTALWHLREGVKLSSLAQRLLETDRLKPQVWCVVGNCFSLQHEHDQAIKCFRRAIQLDPCFAYAYTLCAHEHTASEKFDKAIQMYERAIAIDSRHYNAWWGLGNVYLRQEEHEHAKYHFRKAVEINGSNGVLRASLGMACQQLGESEQALDLFSAAAKSQQCGALASFQRGCSLAALKRHPEAIDELQRAHVAAPREPCVHFELARAHAGSGDLKKAHLHFTRAMDLCGPKDCKDHQLIIKEMLARTSSRDDGF